MPGHDRIVSNARDGEADPVVQWWQTPLHYLGYDIIGEQTGINSLIQRIALLRRIIGCPLRVEPTPLKALHKSDAISDQQERTYHPRCSNP